MIEALPHTKLMNRTIALFYPENNWPDVFHKCGYKISVIEQTLITKKQATVKPDIIAASNKHKHALVIECKSGKNIDKEQEERYAQLDIDTLKLWVSTNPPLQKHTAIYAINSHGIERIKSHTKLPIIVFYDVYLLGIGTFGVKETDAAISSPISFDGMIEPTDQYPYGAEDSDAVIYQYVLQGLVQLIRKKDIKVEMDDDETIEKILKINHRYHKVLSTEITNQLKKKIKNVIRSNFSTDPKIKNQLEKIHDGQSTTAWINLLNLCKKNVLRESKQTRL